MSDTSTIKLLTFREVVRRRPGMYIGESGVEALQQLIDEVASNAIDQFLMGRASMLGVTVRDDGIEVRDDGPGMPFDIAGPEAGISLATHYLTTSHMTARADDHAPHVHLHRIGGCGLAMVVAYSRRFVCDSWRNGLLWRQSFTEGLPDAPPQIVAQGDGRGTVIELHPDETVIGTGTPSHTLLRSTLFRAAHLFAGLRIELDDEAFCAKQGLADLLHLVTLRDGRWVDRPAFHWRGRHDGFDIEAAATGFGRADRRDCIWRTWVNGRSTLGDGTHRHGFAQALGYARWRPANVMLHVIAHDPRFAGPTRDRYVSVPARAAVRQALKEPLDIYCRAQRIGRYAED